ncbi:unnamed protein product, partial [marine sediment metagenome]
ILEATASIGMDLKVEESGTLDLLADCMAQETVEARVDVLHISCHGVLDPQPCLVLEDEQGGRVTASAEQLAGKLGGSLPRLLCLSACKTAEAGSLALDMIRLGMPSVLGWGGSVGDGEATQFAAGLYQRLARHEQLAEAVARARLDLLRPQGHAPGGLSRRPAQPEQRARDWHLARLFLGPTGGGVLSEGRQARGRLDAEYVKKAFLNPRDQKVPVAGPREFVGRRREIQTILKVFRERSHAGVLV